MNKISEIITKNNIIHKPQRHLILLNQKIVNNSLISSGKILRFIKYHILIPILKKICSIILGHEIWETLKTIRSLTDVLNKLQENQTRLQNNTQQLQKTFDLVLCDPEMAWLYKHRDERMDATVDLFDSERRAFHLARYEFASNFVADKVAADIACGTGYGTELLLVNGNAQNVIGIDFDQETISYAKKYHMRDSIEFVCASGDATGLPEKSIDAVISFETMEHVPSDEALLKEFYRVLRPGGIFICSVPNNWPLEYTPHHVRVYNRHSLVASLSSYFTDITIFNHNSSSDTPFNHGQPAGIKKTTGENESTAECYIAYCTKDNSN